MKGQGGWQMHWLPTPLSPLWNSASTRWEQKEQGGWQKHWPPTPLSLIWASVGTRWEQKEQGGWQGHWPPTPLSPICTSTGTLLTVLLKPVVLFLIVWIGTKKTWRKNGHRCS